MGTKPVQRVMFQGDTKNVVLVFFYEDGTANACAIKVRDVNALAKALKDGLGKRQLPKWASKLITSALAGQEVGNYTCDIAIA